MGFMTVAMAEEPNVTVVVTQLGEDIHVSVDGMPEGDEVTVLVGNVFDDYANDPINTNDIMYIDQKEFVPEGEDEYTFVFKMRDTAQSGTYQVRVGGSNLSNPAAPEGEGGVFTYQASGGSEDGVVTGYIALVSSRSDKSGILVEAKNDKDDETAIASASTAENGKFELSIGDGTYDFVISIPGYIPRIIENVSVENGEASLSTEAEPLELWAGDVDSSGAVSAADLGMLLAGFNTIADDPKYSESIDFDISGSVSASDLGMLLANFNKVSDHYNNSAD
jgi:hypothetical protein